MATATALKPSKQLPPPNSDFYQIAELLGDEERAIVKKVRDFMETKVAPIINKYWVEDAFPFELIPSYKELNIAGLGIDGYGCTRRKPLAGRPGRPWRSRESTCRSAPSFGVHIGLAMGIHRPRRARRSRSRSGFRRWRAWRRSDASALTEPLVGSGTGGGLTTTAKRDGD